MNKIIDKSCDITSDSVVSFSNGGETDVIFLNELEYDSRIL